MNTNMIGLDVFQISLHPCALDKSSLSIERVNIPSLMNSKAIVITFLLS